MYGVIPPEALTVALPFAFPLHLSFDVTLEVNVRLPPEVSVADAVPVHPLWSVTVIVYVPPLKPVAVIFVPPDGVHAYVYGDVPPETVAPIDPLFPAQVGFVVLEIETETPQAGG